jgi:tyrosyl-tRNA synthetase
MPHYEVPENALHEPLLEVLSRIGFLPSKSEGRRLIQQNGLSINKKPVRTPEAQLQDYASEGILRPYFLLQRGKKHLAWLIVRE